MGLCSGISYLRTVRRYCYQGYSDPLGKVPGLLPHRAERIGIEGASRKPHPPAKPLGFGSGFRVEFGLGFRVDDLGLGFWGLCRVNHF